jgi:hypothetical protein
MIENIDFNRADRACKILADRVKTRRQNEPRRIPFAPVLQ